MDKAAAVTYNMILLDLQLPDMNGLEICKELRTMNVTAPILVLTAQQDPGMSVQLLDSGADDYVTKPFGGDVLKARIAALLRRSHRPLEQEQVITVGDMTLNSTRRQVHRAGVAINLRRKEFDILEYLVVNRGRALTRTMIIDHVWEAGANNWNNTIDVHIKHLRDKIDRPFDKPLIKTAYGIGYMIQDE